MAAQYIEVLCMSRGLIRVSRAEIRTAQKAKPSALVMLPDLRLCPPQSIQILEISLGDNHPEVVLQLHGANVVEIAHRQVPEQQSADLVALGVSDIHPIHNEVVGGAPVETVNNHGETVA